MARARHNAAEMEKVLEGIVSEYRARRNEFGEVLKSDC